MTSKDTTPDVPPEAAATQLLFQLGTGYIASAALQVALKLELADRFSSDPMPVAELAKAAAADEDALYRVMRALASLGLLEEPTPRMFRLTLAGSMLRKGPGSFHDMGLWITSPFHFRVYSEMLHTVTTGRPAAEKVTGMPVFEYLVANKELSEIFNNAMTGFSAGVAPAALEAYDFSGIEVLVDVAGGHGMVLSSILRQYPAMRGVLFDLPHVIVEAGPTLDAAGVRDRCETSAGDFFRTVPEGGAAYVMKWIIHDWDDEKATLILKNIHRAMDEKGKLLLIEMVVLEGNQPDPSKFLDLDMMVMTGGRERTEAEFKSLLAASGFELTRVIRTTSPVCVIEAVRV